MYPYLVARKDEGETTAGEQGLSGVHRDLGGGLTLRQATVEDAAAVAAFNSRVHPSPGGPFDQRQPHKGVAADTLDLMTGDHPTCDASHLTVIEDTKTGSIVSSTCLIPQKFSYEEG